MLSILNLFNIKKDLRKTGKISISAYKTLKYDLLELFSNNEINYTAYKTILLILRKLIKT